MRQPDLFTAARTQAPPPPEVPEPGAISIRLHDLLQTARAAAVMPWPPTRARVKELLFHNMANWLPTEERDRLREEFRAEMDRLKHTTPA